MINGKKSLIGLILNQWKLIMLPFIMDGDLKVGIGLISNQKILNITMVKVLVIPLMIVLIVLKMLQIIEILLLIIPIARNGLEFQMLNMLTISFLNSKLFLMLELVSFLMKI